MDYTDEFGSAHNVVSVTNLPDKPDPTVVYHRTGDHQFFKPVVVDYNYGVYIYEKLPKIGDKVYDTFALQHLHEGLFFSPRFLDFAERVAGDTAESPADFESAVWDYFEEIAPAGPASDPDATIFAAHLMLGVSYYRLQSTVAGACTFKLASKASVDFVRVLAGMDVCLRLFCSAAPRMGMQ